MSIDFSIDQLWYLLNLESAYSVIGVENPYIGNSREEIKTNEQFALLSIIQKKIIYLTDHNSIEISDPSLKRIIETCAKPQRCLWLTVSQNGQPQTTSQCFFYFSEKDIVESTRENYSYQLTQIPTIDGLTERLGFYLGDQIESQLTSTAFTLKDTVWTQVMEAFEAKDDRAGKALLVEAGVQEHTRDALTFALRNDPTYFLAIQIHNPTTPESCFTEGIGYLKSCSGEWMFRQHEENGEIYLRFSPANIKEYQDSILAMF